MKNQGNQKHLTFEQRVEIEKGLVENKSFAEIARIIAVADAYDAMTSKRSYRDVMLKADVRQQIEQNAGKRISK